MLNLWINLIIVTLLIAGLTSAFLSLICTFKNIDNKPSRIAAMVSNLCIGIVLLFELIGKYFVHF